MVIGSLTGGAMGSLWSTAMDDFGDAEINGCASGGFVGVLAGLTIGATVGDDLANAQEDAYSGIIVSP